MAEFVPAVRVMSLLHDAVKESRAVSMFYFHNDAVNQEMSIPEDYKRWRVAEAQNQCAPRRTPLLLLPALSALRMRQLTTRCAPCIAGPCSPSASSPSSWTLPPKPRSSALTPPSKCGTS